MADLPFFGNSLFGGSGGSGGGISGVESFSIDDNGYLNVVYVDGRTENLGKVVGEDGSVYVPHISEQKVLSFTIEDSPGEIPDPVDLNPNDEWSSMENEEEGIVTDYVWERM